MDVKIDGLDKLIQTLHRLSDRDTVDGVLMEGLKTAGKLVQGTAKALCPVVTGQLRNSIEVTPIENGVDVGTNVEYAPYVEYGTGRRGDPSVSHTSKKSWVYQGADGKFYTSHGQSPRPFLYPAFEANKENVTMIVEKSLRKAIRKAVK